MRDPTLEELLKPATINGKGIEAYQQMRAFQTSMEAIQHAPGHTSEELSTVSEGILKLSVNHDGQEITH